MARPKDGQPGQKASEAVDTPPSGSSRLPNRVALRVAMNIQAQLLTGVAWEPYLLGPLIAHSIQGAVDDGHLPALTPDDMAQSVHNCQARLMLLRNVPHGEVHSLLDTYQPPGADVHSLTPSATLLMASLIAPVDTRMHPTSKGPIPCYETEIDALLLYAYDRSGCSYAAHLPRLGTTIRH